MIKGPKLSPSQWKFLAGAFSNISQAIILFSLAAIFVPQAVNLPDYFSRIIGLEFLSGGLFLLLAAVIISNKER